MPRHDRSAERARRRERAIVLTLLWICVWAGITAVFLFVAISHWTGLDPDRDSERAQGAMSIVFISGALTVGGIVRFRWLGADSRQNDASGRKERYRRDGRRPLPARGSSARTPMRRLVQAEVTLGELLDQLSDSRAAPVDEVATARDAAADAADRMREVADTLQSVEQAAPHASANERDSLTEGLLRLRRQLDLGLDGYGDLIAAASRVLIETAATASTAERTELTDATDHLAGLAQALRELSES